MKYYIYTLFLIFIFFSIIFFNTINTPFLNNIKYINNYNQIKSKYNNHNYKRFLSDSSFSENNSNIFNENLNETFQKETKIMNYLKSLKEQFKEQLFDGNVTYLNYTDSNLTNITNIAKEGIMRMRIVLPYDQSNNINFEKYPIFKIKILENKTIDNWILISFINNNTQLSKNKSLDKLDRNIIFYSYNETFFNLSYNSLIEKSRYYTFPYYRTFCNCQYNIGFIIKESNESYNNNITNNTNYIFNNITKNITNNSTNNINKNSKEIIGIIGSLFSEDCNIKLKFNLIKHSIAINDFQNSILIYSTIISCLSLFHLINTKIFISKIDLSMVNCNSVCIFTICQNIIWNCYGCYNHFFLLLNYMEYKFYFITVCALFFINFGFIEFPLLYQLLSLKYSNLINDVLSYRKKIIQFCLIFYVTILFSFIFVMKCYYSPPLILFSYIFTWLPQILYNIYSKNRVSFPIIYIIGVILNRIFPSFYFNSFDNNFLRFSTNNRLLILQDILVLIILSLILYSQTLLGPRWFLPMLLVDEYNFYMDEKELRKFKKDLDNLECLICLNPIIENQINNNLNYDNGAAFNETDSLIIEVNDNTGNFEEKKKKKCFNCCCRFKYKEKCFGEKSIICNFHEFSKNIMNKPFMITPCMHVFHSDCLEEWFKMKKECPNCRTMITQDMYN